MEAGVATLTLNRPHKLNSFTEEMLVEMRAALTAAAADDDIRALLLTAAGRAMAAQFATGPTAGYGMLKRAIDAAATNDLDAQLDLERDLQRAAGQTADYREGVAAFLEKRAPEFRGE